MAFQSAPFPSDDPIVDQKGRATQVLVDWATELSKDVDTSPSRLITVTLEAQGAAIGTTSFPIGVLAAGLYRFSWYARITRAATVSSSLTVNASFTESGLSLQQSGTAVTGNTTATVQSAGLIVLIDGGTPVSYSTAYASVGGTSMLYRLTLLLEQIAA